MSRTVVIGAGLAGLCAALRLQQAGRDVTLVTAGIGGLQLGQGSLDVLGYAPERVGEPLAAMRDFAAAHPEHPYAHFTPEFVGRAVEWLARLVGPAYLVGRASRNRMLPTALGAIRPTALVPPSFEGGEVRGGAPVVLVGLDRLKDFYPRLAAENLDRQRDARGEALQVRAVHVDFEARPGEVDTSGVNTARALDQAQARERIANLVGPELRDGEAVGFPAVLGLRDATAWRDVATRLAHPVFEVALQPPSVPGMRLNERLTSLAKRAGVRVVLGPRVLAYDAQGGRIASVTLDTAGHERAVAGDQFVLATGGFESGGLRLDSHGRVSEAVFDLPVAGAEGELLTPDYRGADQPLFRCGLRVDDAMHPLDRGGRPAFDNLYAAGGLLAGAMRWREKSGDGIAVASAWRAAETIVEETHA